MKTRFAFKRACTTLLLGAAALAAMPSGAQERAPGTLKVAAFGGTFTAAQKKYIGDLFTRRTGMKVQYIDGNANEFIGQLIASKGRTPPYDVLYLEQDVRDSAISAGVFAKADPAIVTNLKYLYDEAKQPDGYGPGMAFYSVGIAYNTKKFAEAGIPAP
ncbi:MAG TPA: extracellular solute-binding protein, partial [Bordetella sp.]